MRPIRNGSKFSQLRETGTLVFEDEEDRYRFSTGFLGRVPVQEILKSKRIQALKTDITDFKSGSLPVTPESVAITPIEMYSPGQPHPLRLQSTQRTALRPVTPNGHRAMAFPITPIATDLASLSMLASLSEPPSADSNAEYSPGGTAIKLRSGSVLTVITPEQNAWQRSLYMHGPVRLQKPAVLLKKNSIASLDAFQDALESHEEETSRRPSDDTSLDDLVDFMDSFGFELVSFELDEYWDTGLKPQRALPASGERRPTLPGERRPTLPGSPFKEQFLFASPIGAHSTRTPSPDKRRMLSLAPDQPEKPLPALPPPGSVLSPTSPFQATTANSVAKGATVVVAVVAEAKSAG
ncbi:hypothetical protein H2199_001386 [Coniosporium tulheliwenetii]|uniref:Uncharacterized protein n=1 Tax=Coniosporium tulheliwenetii TaxID=3383036 RepID=A0ACC2ZLV4_9PEZI|nr:hypothetical protein H2199_001386 [Cladosporium sp. JES 115]